MMSTLGKKHPTFENAPGDIAGSKKGRMRRQTAGASAL